MTERPEDQLRRDRCPVTVAVDVIGGKWKPLIVHSLLDRTLRFGELRRLIPTVTQQMLTLQLRELEHDGVVYREVYRQVPPKVEYSLTSTGQGLRPVIENMTSWGRSYIDARSQTQDASNTAAS